LVKDVNDQLGRNSHEDNTVD